VSPNYLQACFVENKKEELLIFWFVSGSSSIDAFSRFGGA